MKKRIIVTATIAACLALCAAVWPQAETVKETPISNKTPAVAAPKPESAPAETSAVPEVPPVPEQESATESVPETVTVQTAIEPQSSDMVYVEGFGWIESQGPNHVEYAEDMYENGNKIGIMG